MILKGLLEKLPVRSTLLKLILGSAAAALLVSLGTVFVLHLLAMQINPAIPAVLGAIAAALFAARMSDVG